MHENPWLRLPRREAEDLAKTLDGDRTCGNTCRCGCRDSRSGIGTPPTQHAAVRPEYLMR
jgi:hypothetical protein